MKSQHKTKWKMITHSLDLFTWRSKNETEKEVEAEDHQKETWLVTESLPYGHDAAETLPMDLGSAIPTTVGVLLKKEETIKEQNIVEGEDGKNDQEEEQEVLITGWKSTSASMHDVCS